MEVISVNRNEIRLGDRMWDAPITAIVNDPAKPDEVGFAIKISDERTVIMWMGEDDTVEVERGNQE